VVSFTPQPIYLPREKPLVSIGDWMISTAGLVDVEKRKFFIIPGFEL
jgi:hypothetical protein